MFLTPTSKKIRLKRLHRQRLELKKNRILTAKLATHSIWLDNCQSQEMKEIVDNINTNFSNDVNDVLSEISDNAFREALKGVWKQNSRKQLAKDRKGFNKDQVRNSQSKKSNKWNTVTLRMALAVYSRSPAAYWALCKFELLQLPSIWTLKNNFKQYNEQPGVNHSYLAKQRLKYANCKKISEERGEVGPTDEGMLIFDEVKVLDKIIWNSKNHAFIGLAMAENELPSIRDICDNGLVPTATQYVLCRIYVLY